MNAHAFMGTGRRGEKAARSELVFAALVHVPERYQLCQVTGKGARKLHKPNERMQDTVNQVLMILTAASPLSAVPSAPKKIPSASQSVLQASYISDATHIALSQTVFIPEERNFSHV